MDASPRKINFAVEVNVMCFLCYLFKNLPWFLIWFLVGYDADLVSCGKRGEGLMDLVNFDSFFKLNRWSIVRDISFDILKQLVFIDMWSLYPSSS